MIVSRSIPGLVRWGFLGLSLVLFVASLPFNAYYTGEGEPQPGGPGVMLLLLGWLGVLDGIVAWLANPLVVFAWATMPFRVTRFVSFGLAALAVPIGLSFLLQQSMMMNEGGTRAPIVGYGPAFPLWVASLAAASFGSFVGLFVPKAVRRGPSNDRDGPLEPIWVN